MNDPRFIRQSTASCGNGVFAAQPIAKGEKLFAIEGQVLATAELTDDMRALQIGDDLWITSDGSSLDDDVNHSCEPSAGFITGEPVLYALKDLQIGDEVTWDYSTSLNEPGWHLDCRCGCVDCRGVIRPWHELDHATQQRLLPTALNYLRSRNRP